MKRQATFEAFEPDRSEFPGVRPDEWGPTTRRPVPEVEHPTLRCGPGFDKRRLIGTGLAPSDFEIVAGVCSPETAREQGYHPDDAQASWEVPGRLFGDDSRRQELEALISDDLAKLTDTMRQTRNADDGRSNEQQPTNGARSTTRAVANDSEHPDTETVLDVVNSVGDPDEFREKMDEHGEEIATDGGRDEVTATMQEYRDAHPDYRGEVNGRKAVLKMTPNGTALIPVEDGGA